MARKFRSPESYESEKVRRRLVVGFLARRGFRAISTKSVRNGQTVTATSPEGESLVMRIKLCWPAKNYAASQLCSKAETDQHEAAIRRRCEREASVGTTHFLLVQESQMRIAHAALIPIRAILPIWQSQFLLDQAAARNGTSPTIWLYDDRKQSSALSEVLWSHQGVRDLTRLRDRLGDEQAVHDDALDPAYMPDGGDRRELVERQIRARRGQQQFRDALRQRYGDRCAITGSTVLAVLEAAHILPYRGENDNHPENGLLLRADIHTLFDLNLLGIEPVHLRVKLHPLVAATEEYNHLAGRQLEFLPNRQPSEEALRQRYEQFLNG